MAIIAVLEQWRSVSNPGSYELAVEMDAGSLPEIDDEIEVPGVGRCKVIGAWRALKYKSQTVKGDRVVARLDVEVME